jgi:hypothetical protein
LIIEPHVQQGRSIGLGLPLDKRRFMVMTAAVSVTCPLHGHPQNTAAPDALDIRSHPADPVIGREEAAAGLRIGLDWKYPGGSR